MSDADKAELEALKARVRQLEDGPKPTRQAGPAWDYTAGMSMPASAVKAMVDAVPTSQVRALVNDFRRGPTPPGGHQPPRPETVERGTGWVEPRPLEAPPGIRY